MALPRHIRLAGLALLEHKLAEIAAPSLGALRAAKTKELNKLPVANIPKVVSFPTS